MHDRAHIYRFGLKLILFCQKFLAATFTDNFTLSGSSLCFGPLTGFGRSQTRDEGTDGYTSPPQCKCPSHWWSCASGKILPLNPVAEKAFVWVKEGISPPPLLCPATAGETGLILMSLVTQTPFHMS